MMPPSSRTWWRFRMPVTLLGVMLNALLAAGVSEAALAPSEYPVPVRFTLSPLKTATPAEALAINVPERVAPGVPPMSDRKMRAVEEVTVFPAASVTATSTAGVMDWPASVLDGWTVKASREAGPTTTEKG